jgi:hypothetical protein
MNRIRGHEKKILYAMEPKMRRIMEKLKTDADDDYFKLDPEEREGVVSHIALTVINTTVQILNGYNRDELPDIMGLSITNLLSLEEKFTQLEMYAQAQMMNDTIKKIENDLFELVKDKL